MRPSRLPRATAACTKSRSRIDSTSPRTTRAYTTPDDRDGEQDEGKGELDVGEPHEEVVDLAPEVAGDKADHHAEHARDEHGRQANHQRDAGAENHPGEDVASEMIRPQQMRLPRRVPPAGLLEALV